MKIFYVLFILFIIAACNANPTPQDVESKLKSVMIEFLYKSVNNDSAHVKYHIEKLYYFDDNINKHYICDFKVRMITRLGLDTTGTMRAYISEDFTKVERGY